MAKLNTHIVNDDLNEDVISPPIKKNLYFFCSFLIELSINFIFFLEKFFFVPENESSIYLGSAPLEITSEI